MLRSRVSLWCLWLSARSPFNSKHHHTVPPDVTQHQTTSRNITQQQTPSRIITQHHMTYNRITQHHTSSHNITQHHTYFSFAIYLKRLFSKIASSRRKQFYFFPKKNFFSHPTFFFFLRPLEAEKKLKVSFRTLLPWAYYFFQFEALKATHQEYSGLDIHLAINCRLRFWGCSAIFQAMLVSLGKFKLQDQA